MHLILFTIKINVCYQLLEHLARAYFPLSRLAIAEEKASKTLPLSDERKMLETELFSCLPDMHEKKLQSVLISNNFFYLENGKAYLMLCFILTGE
jgi:hypothetical protein